MQKFRLKVFLLSLVVYLFSNEGWAFKKCQGPEMVEKDGLCVCVATQRKFHPKLEPNEPNYCKFTTALENLCQSKKGYLSIGLGHGCRCNKTRQNLNSPARFERDGTRSAYLSGISEDTPDVLAKEASPEDIEAAITSLKERIAECIQVSELLDQLDSQLKSLGSYKGSRENYLDDFTMVNWPILKRVPQYVLDRDPGAATLKSDLSTRKPGKWGGSLYTARLRYGAEQWRHLKDYPDPQGDPEIFIRGMGPHLSQFFETEFDQFTFKFSNLQNINGGIKSLNEKIKRFNQAEVRPRIFSDTDPISIEFEEAPLEGSSGPRRFLSKFAYESKLPLGELKEGADQLVFFHDYLFHFPGYIQLPNLIVEFSKNLNRAVLEFESYLKQNHLKLAESDFIKYLFSKVIVARTVQIDLGSVAVSTLRSLDVSASVSESDKLRSTLKDVLGFLGVKSTLHRFYHHKNYVFSVGNQLDSSFRDYAPYFPGKAEKKEFYGALQAFIESKTEDPRYQMTLSRDYFEKILVHLRSRIQFLDRLTGVESQ